MVWNRNINVSINNVITVYILIQKKMVSLTTHRDEPRTQYHQTLWRYDHDDTVGLLRWVYHHERPCKIERMECTPVGNPQSWVPSPTKGFRGRGHLGIGILRQLSWVIKRGFYRWRSHFSTGGLLSDRETLKRNRI